MTIIAGTSTDCIDAAGAAAADTAVTSQGEAGMSTATDAPTSVPASGYPSGLYGFSNSEFSALPAVRFLKVQCRYHADLDFSLLASLSSALRNLASLSHTRLSSLALVLMEHTLLPVG